MKDIVEIVVPDTVGKKGSLYIRDRLQRVLYSFIGHESFGGILLFFCVVVAMIIANTSSLSDSYFKFWETKIGFCINDANYSMSILHFINDVLMSLFFLMVGLEMKREVLYGDLAGFKKVSFSIFAALGGIIIPIIVYVLFNYNTDASKGFGVAMSTDTAFALGVILLMGKRIPSVIKIFLVTLAVADDLGAVTVIAIFYTEDLQILWMVFSCIIIMALIYLNYKDTKFIFLYFIFGILLWIAVYKSGIHPTVAAVLLAFCIPGKTKVSSVYFEKMLKEWQKLDFDEIQQMKDVYTQKRGFFKKLSDGVKNFIHPSAEKKIDMYRESKYIYILDSIGRYSYAAQNPLLRTEHALQPICAYFIVPLFAFANGGVLIDQGIDFLNSGIMWGTIFGLVLGKPLGILIFAYFSERLKISIRPRGLRYSHVLAVGFLAGIGFTMSMFVSGLAYTEQEMINISKLSVLIASALAIIFGVVALFFSTKIKEKNGAKNIS
ncbi:Na+/H+ antiporter NhaA [Helicobacter anatolicus]|uniref:Na+/H+ antiporter NhaA n=1 Tax=Helicobacter anatolicus TaxID=2905874 RepID=UPI001E41C40B|nr:Na+/H+ antiporter NhaA [Helicobacter anatolicus]MCE3039309.1 Na+/H+ antiporter NhaA [Helicobacter anatolicus]